mmetsp:Transcript_54415/g.157348  ORF Transcript_54415/g.157348 Transcript_54415/m.157348 type:complete len:96 (-) Transcript_54415:105-392(-)
MDFRLLSPRDLLPPFRTHDDVLQNFEQSSLLENLTTISRKKQCSLFRQQGWMMIRQQIRSLEFFEPLGWHELGTGPIPTMKTSMLSTDSIPLART